MPELLGWWWRCRSSPTRRRSGRCGSPSVRAARRGRALANATFQIVGPSGASLTTRTGTTQSDGTLCVPGLAFGSYTVQETQGPPGFLDDDTTARPVTIGAVGSCPSTGRAVGGPGLYRLAASGAMRITKRAGGAQGPALANATFQIVGPSGANSTTRTGTTQSDGTLCAWAGVWQLHGAGDAGAAGVCDDRRHDSAAGDDWRGGVVPEHWGGGGGAGLHRHGGDRGAADHQACGRRAGAGAGKRHVPDLGTERGELDDADGDDAE